MDSLDNDQRSLQGEEAALASHFTLPGAACTADKDTAAISERLQRRCLLLCTPLRISGVAYDSAGTGQQRSNGGNKHRVVGIALSPPPRLAAAVHQRASKQTAAGMLEHPHRWRRII